MGIFKGFLRPLERYTAHHILPHFEHKFGGFFGEMDTAESIRQHGVLVPAIARPDPDGGYELISGHRRHHASEIAGREAMPVIVRELDDDAATIIMVDSNLQREELLPSERAFVYKMKLEAMKHQGIRTKLRGYRLN